jgi:hypothetical protein
MFLFAVGAWIVWDVHLPYTSPINDVSISIPVPILIELCISLRFGWNGLTLGLHRLVSLSLRMQGKAKSAKR